MTPDEITNDLLRHFDSATRVAAMIRALSTVSRPVFWKVFLSVWNVCDDTWSHRAEILKLLRLHAPCRPFMGEEDAAFFDSLPAVVTIFRGTTRVRVRGLSWTTEPRIAFDFAGGHRGIRLPEPVIAEARIAREAVLAVATERQESELLIDPKALRSLTIIPW